MANINPIGQDLTTGQLRPLSPLDVLANSAGGNVSGVLPSNADGRLTASSTLPVPNADVTAATSIYYLPYLGRSVALYNNSWAYYDIGASGVAQSLSGFAANTNFDAFLYNNSGVVTIETVAWSTSGAGTSARATALARQDGVLVKSGDATRRYLGTFRTTGTTGQTEDSQANRYVWNAQNRVLRISFRQAGGYTRNSTTVQQAANGSANVRTDLVVGLDHNVETTVDALIQPFATDQAFVGISLNAVAIQSAVATWPQSVYNMGSIHFNALVVPGYNFLTAIDWLSGSTDTVNYYVLNFMCPVET